MEYARPLQSTKSVSYTHLDVYKRQVFPLSLLNALEYIILSLSRINSDLYRDLGVFSASNLLIYLCGTFSNSNLVVSEFTLFPLKLIIRFKPADFDEVVDFAVVFDDFFV